MGVMVVIILLILLIISVFVKKRSVYSPGALFLILWVVISFGAHFCSIWGIPEVSNKTWLIILVGVFSFWAGSEFSAITLNDYREISPHIDASEGLNRKRLLLFCLLASPFIVHMYLSAITMLKQGLTFLYIRASYYGLNGLDVYWATSPIARLGEKFFVSPLKTAIIPLTITTCIRRKIDWALLVLSIILVVEDILTTGGRFVLSYIIIQVFIAMAVSKIRIRIRKGVKIALLILLIGAIVGIVGITNNRGINSSWEDKVYEYFFCCIPLLDYYVPKINTYTFGTASLNGFINPILSLLSPFFSLFTPYERIIGSQLNIQKAVSLSNSITTNAFVTSFFYTYLDLGFVGTAIGLFLFGN